MERAGRTRAQLAASAVLARAAHRSHFAAASAGHGRLNSPAAAVADRHGELVGAHRRAESGDVGSYDAADGGRHGTLVHG